jgi:hypothetical protein
MRSVRGGAGEQREQEDERHLSAARVLDGRSRRPEHLAFQPRCAPSSGHTVHFSTSHRLALAAIESLAGPIRSRPDAPPMLPNLLPENIEPVTSDLHVAPRRPTDGSRCIGRHPGMIAPSRVGRGPARARPMLEVRPSTIYGRGCFTTAPIRRRAKIAHYAGEVVAGRRLIAARVRRQAKQGAIKVIWVTDDVAVDGDVGGDATAFINHSCAPNAFMRGAARGRVHFFALRDIAEGEEITIDYRDEDHPAAHACRCGAMACRSRGQDGANRAGRRSGAPS